MSVVETQYGKLRGYEENGLHIFKGIPYAKPPVGNLRFRAPEKPEAWTGERDATKPGGNAPQAPMGTRRVPNQNEDCLYLNVNTPGCDDKKRPVMLWLHGGGFNSGSGSGPESDVTALATRGDLVIVTINYRLGALGFAHFGELFGSDFPTTSNNGLRDQVAALEWVQDNIANFGGDPNNVTVFGQSAGGISVASLIGMSQTKGLIHKAVAQSGGLNQWTSPYCATTVATEFLKELNIDPDDPQKLWELEWKEILAAQAKATSVKIKIGVKGGHGLGVNFIPIIGDDLMPLQPIKAVQKGNARDITLMVGTVRDEWKLFSKLASMAPKGSPATEGITSPKTEEDLLAACEIILGNDAQEAIDTIRSARGSETRTGDVYDTFQTDYLFRIPAVQLAEQQAKHNANTYMYRIDWESPTFGASHIVDVPLVFGNTDSMMGKMFTGGGPDAKALSEKMMDAWISFARTGNPGHADLPEWKTYDHDNRTTIIFNKECSTENDPKKEERKFWDGKY